MVPARVWDPNWDPVRCFSGYRVGVVQWVVLQIRPRPSTRRWWKKALEDPMRMKGRRSGFETMDPDPMLRWDLESGRVRVGIGLREWNGVGGNRE